MALGGSYLDYVCVTTMVFLSFLLGRLWANAGAELSVMEHFGRAPVFGVFSDFLLDLVDWISAQYKLNVKYAFMRRTLESLCGTSRDLGVLAAVTTGARTLLKRLTSPQTGGIFSAALFGT